MIIRTLVSALAITLVSGTATLAGPLAALDSKDGAGATSLKAGPHHKHQKKGLKHHGKHHKAAQPGQPAAS